MRHVFMRVDTAAKGVIAKPFKPLNAIIDKAARPLVKKAVVGRCWPFL